MAELGERILALAEEKNAALLRRTIPGIAPETVLGGRMPALRQLAREYAGTAEADAFMAALPHRYLEENLLHACLLDRVRDRAALLEGLGAFLPRVDNWAVCDTLAPKALMKDPADTLRRAYAWMGSPHLYTARFGVGVLMRFYLGGHFDAEQPRRVAALRRDEYYLNMMRAWYFAEALAKRYDEVLPLLFGGGMDAWTLRMSVRKARESFRVPDAHKAELAGLLREAARSFPSPTRKEESL